MIPFRCKMRDSTYTPMVRNELIWEYAETLVEDYKPSLLKEPTPINAVNFLESYLGATVDYQYIYFPKGSPPIAGATVFNDDQIKVFDRDNLCVRTIEVSAGTIIIDNTTVEMGNKGYELFTALHEGGHFTMHQEVYRQDKNRTGASMPHRTGNNLVCCRRDTMFLSGYGRRLTPAQNREHQANTFSAFAAMPRKTFIPFATTLIHEIGFPGNVFVDDEKSWESGLALEDVCKKLSEAYGVSLTAAKIHLKELGMLMNVPQYENLTGQRVDIW